MPSRKEKKKGHDFVGAGIFSYCRKCGRLILSLGIPQKPCEPKKILTSPYDPQ